MSTLKRLFLVFIRQTLKKDSTSLSHLTDEALVSRIRETKDGETFGILYDRYGNKVYNKCFSFVKNAHEAKDLVQDIFLKVFINLKSFNPEKASFSTWLYVITYNYCTSYITRTKSKRISLASSDKQVMKDPGVSDIPLDEINQLEIDKLRKALDMIPAHEKSLLLLKYQDNTPIKEIRKLLGISESAVKMRLSRAKERVVKTYNNL